MRMQLEMRPRLEQRLKLAPQIIQSIEILQLPLLELQERIEQEQLENPVLEIEEIEAAEDTDQPDEPADRKADERIVEGEDFAKLDNLPDDFRDYFYQTSQRRAPSDARDEKLDAIQNTPGRSMPLAECLIGQLALMEVPERTREIAEVICNNLDRDGRLAYSLEEIAAAMEPAPSAAEAEEALRVVQSLDPPGVAAANLEECLLLQINPRDPDYRFYEMLIRNHLHDIEMNRLPRIAREMDAGLEDVKLAVEFVVSLDPAPGRLYDNEVVPYVAPEVNVRLMDGQYQVSLEERGMPRLRINEEYRSMARDKGADTRTREFLRKKTDSARWLIDAIQQRRRTVLRISREVVKAQREFLERGVSALKPLKMQEVADRTEVHVATVSRAIRDKYMQTPRGVFPIKFFFTGGTRGADGEMESWNAIKQRISEIVEKEDKRRPYSDDEITQQLREAGVDIARRTVTKYRRGLDIPSSRQRRRY